MGEMIRCGSSAVNRAADVIRAGGVVVFPTDTVYGVGCDPYNTEAVRRLYAIKGRDASKPLPVLVRSVPVASRIGVMEQEAVKLAARHWPGPLTMILDVADAALASSMALSDGVAVRVPAGECVSALLQRCDLVVGTSANRSGEASPVSSDDIDIEYDVLLDGGATSRRVESTIVDARRGGGMRVIRHGALDVQI